MSSVYSPISQGKGSQYQWLNPQTGSAGEGLVPSFYQPSGGEMSLWNDRPSFEPSPGYDPSFRIDQPYSAGATPSAAQAFSAENVGGDQKKAANVLGGISAASSLIPGIGTIISGITGAGALIMNWWATDKQMEENKRAKREAQAAYQAEQAENKRRYDIEGARADKTLKAQLEQAEFGRGLSTRQQAHAEKMDTEKLALAQKSDQYDKWLQMFQGISSMMSSPQSRAGFAQLFRRG